jgi:hypothetical protein
MLTDNMGRQRADPSQQASALQTRCLRGRAPGDSDHFTAHVPLGTVGVVGRGEHHRFQRNWAMLDFLAVQYGAADED